MTWARAREEALTYPCLLQSWEQKTNGSFCNSNNSADTKQMGQVWKSSGSTVLAHTAHGGRLSSLSAAAAAAAAFALSCRILAFFALSTS